MCIDRIVLDGAVPGADLVVMNTDVQSLTSSVASQKVQLGRGVTRGLGAGGDPEIGFGAAEEAQEEIREALEGARLDFPVRGARRRHRLRRGAADREHGQGERLAGGGDGDDAVYLRGQAARRPGRATRSISLQADGRRRDLF